MKKIIPILAAVCMILVIILGALGVFVIKKYSPSKELADLNQIYDIEDGKTSVIYNFELQEVKGIYENGQTYLPLSWINERLNKRFYWDKGDNLLIYALPDQLVYADAATVGGSGAPLLLVRDDDIYLTLGLIASYTNVEILSYDNEDSRRVFLTNWGERTTAQVTKDTQVREKGGIKSPILTEVSRGSEVIVLEAMEDWSKVMAPGGHIGYMQNRRLSQPEPRELSGNFTEPVYNSTRLDEKITLVWHQVTNMDANNSFPGNLEEAGEVNVVSPTWFALTDNQGNYKSYASREYVDRAHERGIQVWALLDNFSNDVNTGVLMSSAATRRRLIDNLMADVEKYDLDGLNMDFEGIAPEAGPHYVQFLRELSIPCREQGVILSVDNYVPTSYNSFYDWNEQGTVADYVIVMGYDEHYAGGEPGSVASYEFVRSGIEGMLKEVPKEKLINAVPFYTRLWTDTDEGTKSSAMGIRQAKDWIQQNGVELYWQQELGQYYGDCETDDGLQYLWMEEEDSLRLKMDLIKEKDLAGVACWKLGLEDAAAWEAVSWN